MNISGSIAERTTGYFAKCRSISASTSAEKVAASTPKSTGCERGWILVSWELISFKKGSLVLGIWSLMCSHSSVISQLKPKTKDQRPKTKVQLSIYLPQNYVQRSDNRHDIRHHCPLGHVRQGREIHKT